MRPSVVVKVTSVPLCGGVPAASRTVATRSVVPWIGSAVRRRRQSDGRPGRGQSGTFSHATVTSAAVARTRASTRGAVRFDRGIMNAVNILIPMHLAGQERNPRHRRAILGSQNGYAMVALLIALSVMAIMLTVAMPVWQPGVQREKEAELVFRGQQYARAIELLPAQDARRTAAEPGLLVDQKFLRKKYKDPITGDDFLLAAAGRRRRRGAAAARAADAGRASAGARRGSNRQSRRRRRSPARGGADTQARRGGRRHHGRRQQEHGGVACASTTAAPTTTSGSSCTSRKPQRRAQAGATGDAAHLGNAEGRRRRADEACLRLDRAAPAEVGLSRTWRRAVPSRRGGRQGRSAASRHARSSIET